MSIMAYLKGDRYQKRWKDSRKSQQTSLESGESLISEASFTFSLDKVSRRLYSDSVAHHIGAMKQAWWGSAVPRILP
ncbi:hypothetical protein SERLA73DRAFT_132075 [Serpula lacrymans var. lacrymans S7.3]|uniref:Uncharacterized protein n=2 Tax=Serpula lacrymans var. lacrymans TaxID=341189 RepID=F8PQY8_SERL3|nr:uncharacterized protein SERLADRAFT_381878 [Serpula lacrymans var. lacrymans S7.9]EGO01645.1 hypothetical protein SERLA73DRAFT_132075 [Serpula lacrymans var. lacrymans S7.3]EGO27296.1 hypothetical protein SERLADRAFT_381878 [Serpula lacrymans var. lacrymans S7.9]